MGRPLQSLSDGPAVRIEQNGEYLLEEQVLEGRRQELLGRFQGFGMVGHSRALLQVFDAVERVSDTHPPIPVLITGETGVGKELVARAIHACDPQRKTQPFLAVNCSAVNASLVESELFGHRRGAFTSAMNEQRGVFRAANGGTIFLDVIEALSADMQPKLLRVLEEDCVRPVGDVNSVPIDVRIISATNIPLPELIAQGRFREDLHFRLNVYEIVIPPLRERPEDIPLQANYSLERHQNVTQGRVTGIEPEALTLLTALPWEGNSRELDHVIWSALVRNRGGSLLAVRDVQASLRPHSTPTRSAQFSLVGTSAEVERQLIVHALNKCDQNRTHAARKLGISTPTLYCKMRKHSLMQESSPKP